MQTDFNDLLLNSGKIFLASFTVQSSDTFGSTFSVDKNSFLKKLFPGKNQHKSHDSSYKSHPKERFSESYGVIQDHLPNAPEGKKRPDPVDNKNQYHYGSPVNTARRKNPESTVQDTGLSTNQRAFQ